MKKSSLKVVALLFLCIITGVLGIDLASLVELVRIIYLDVFVIDLAKLHILIATLALAKLEQYIEGGKG